MMEKTIIDEMLERANVVFYMPELPIIQSRLKVPKDKRNDFGKYYYRSASDILEQVKPILEEVQCVLTTPSVKIYTPNGKDVRVYAIITNSKGETMYATHEAGIEDAKKGMDAAQISGAAESYAKKYALGNLFAIDDTKDADATNTHDVEVKPKRTSKAKAQAEETPVPEQAPEPTPEPSAPAVDAEVEYAIHGCATRAELKALMNSQPDWTKDDAIRDMANKYFYELKN